MNDTLHAAARALVASRRVVVISGAGVSAESEIPTFRETMEGLWKDFDPQTLATPEAFENDPQRVSKWYDWRRQKCLEAEPNPGHVALAQIESWVVSRGGWFTLLTQNVDRWHHKAGSKNVVERHGTIMIWRCTKTGRHVEPKPEPFDEYPPTSPFADGALLRPNVVWFGEMLPLEAIEAADNAVRACDLFMSVGTSSVVYPAAGFIQMAASIGASTIEVNPQRTPISAIVDHALVGKSGEVLPELAMLMRTAN